MIIHHLYAFPNRIQYNYITIGNMDNYIANFGKICVSIFLFISGFGTYCSLSDKKNNLFKLKQKILSIYLNYWVVFCIFIPIGFIKYKINFDINEFIGNFLGFKSTYNGEWWFFRIYILLLIISVFVINKFSENKVIAFMQAYSGYLLAIILARIFDKFGVDDIYITREIISLLRLSSCFFIGVFFAKFTMFDTFYRKLLLMKLNNNFIYLSMIFIIMLTRDSIPGSEGRDAIITPIFIFCIMNLVKNKKVKQSLSTLGKHSNNMWLTHSFFCYYYFQWIIFLPKYSLIITIWLILISFITSYLINLMIIKIKTTFINYKSIANDFILEKSK